ncbi:hypothetical protein CLOP_g5884 [Closterium sp. NIES-67]|nr:hypothetical protein CLOP_g5884 [Closterium sp. NIES-67]
MEGNDDYACRCTNGFGTGTTSSSRLGKVTGAAAATDPYGEDEGSSGATSGGATSGMGGMENVDDLDV